MKHQHSPCIALLMVGTVLALTALSVQAAMQSAPDCRLPLAVVTGSDLDELNCLPSTKRVALLTHPPEQMVLPALDRDHRLQSALHELKAQESEALAVPDPSAGKVLDAYLAGREIESRRSSALRSTKRELAKTESRMVRKSADLALAATAATDWVRRQPGRDIPDAYRQRVVSAAAAILAEDLHRQRLESACDDVNREYDRELQRALRLHS